MELEVEKALANIRKFRELKGLSRDQIAAELELSSSGYGKLERGVSELSLQRLAQIAKILEVPISKILNTDASSNFSLSNNTIDNYGTVIDNSSQKTEYANSVFLKYIAELEQKLKRYEEADNKKH